MHVAIVPHDAMWKHEFSVESDRIRRALGQNVQAVHHIGSTRIPGILAKPIIDILVEVLRIERVDGRDSNMEALGYEACGEHGIAGRRYFRKSGAAGRGAFHVHVFRSGSQQASAHIAFRDYLLACPDIAQEYSTLKARLMADAASSSVEYQAAKAPFVEAVVADAVEWFRGRY